MAQLTCNALRSALTGLMLIASIFLSQGQAQVRKSAVKFHEIQNGKMILYCSVKALYNANGDLVRHKQKNNPKSKLKSIQKSYYYFDAAGKKSSLSFIDCRKGGMCLKRTYTYRHTPNTEEQTSGSWKSTSIYDSLNRISQILGYDSGRLKSVQKYQYDSMGRLLSEVFAMTDSAGYPKNTFWMYNESTDTLRRKVEFFKNGKLERNEEQIWYLDKKKQVYKIESITDKSVILFTYKKRKEIDNHYDQKGVLISYVRSRISPPGQSMGLVPLRYFR